MQHLPHDAMDMSDTQIIEALGGTTKVARALGCDWRVITAWKKRGISAAGKYRIRDLARRRRFSLPGDFMDRAPQPK